MDFNVGITEIPDDLRNECRELFGQFVELTSPDRLRGFVSVTELRLVKRCVPASGELEYDIFISKLLITRRAPLKPALFDLLDALASRYKDETKAETCAQLKEKIREALLKADKPEKDYQRLVEISAPSDEQGMDERAAQWIEEAGDSLDERALRITLAIFHGTTFETIERAKNDLLKAFQELVPPPPPPPDPEAAPPPPPPHVPLMQRLKRAGAYETNGKPPDWKKVVELKERELELAGEALVYAWQFHRETEWREKLIGWLTSYAGGRSADARTRAAVAAGILAVKDYRFVRENLLELWVQGNDAKYRTAIGMALGVLVREESWAAEVQSLLRKWSESSEQAERWAALRAYIYVGAYCRPVSEVITRWRAIAASEYAAVLIQVSEDKALRLNNPMHMSLMDAMVRFFVGVAQMPEEKKRPLFAGILEGLKKWVEAAKADAGLGLFMFTTLGRLVVGADGESDGAPVLLQLLPEGPGGDETGYRTQLAGLFEALMRNGATITEARELLCAWLGWANELEDNSQSYEPRIGTLLKEIIAADKSGRARGKLAVCLRDCGRNRTAQSLLSKL